MSRASIAKIAATLLVFGLLWIADRVLDLGPFRADDPRTVSSSGAPPTREAPPSARGRTTPDAAAKPARTTATVPPPVTAEDDRALREARREKRSDAQVEVRAQVSKLLADDDETPRHQRFILGLSDGSTVLVAHNIDLAPRVPVEKGSVLRAFGEFEWNEKGGVLHWTHQDPKGRHWDGWIEVDGRKYQ